MTKKINGYEQIYLDLAKNLKNFDLAGNAPHLGLTAKDENVLINFLDRDYVVSPGGVSPQDGRPAGVNHLSLVAHYAMSPGRGEPSGDFLPLGRMTGMVESRKSFDDSMVNNTLVRNFPDAQSFGTALKRLGGWAAGQAPSGGLSWLIKPFPKIPLQFIHFPADDEFEAEYRLMFDSAATAFMEFEALGFLTGVLIHELCGE